jgi:hypothetical protein
MIIQKIKYPPNTNCNNNKVFTQLLIGQSKYIYMHPKKLSICYSFHENHHFFEVSENNQNQQFFCF